MALIYVTGNSGAGKSSVRAELRHRGFEAHDTDDGGLTSWRHKITGEESVRPSETEGRTHAWYAEHDWTISRERIEDLVVRARAKVVFLCGSPSNAAEMLDLFDKVICLSVDDGTLRRRLMNRVGNDFGKAPDELSNILGWHESFEDGYRRRGAIMIDATKSLSDVVDDIVGSVAGQS